MVMGWDMTVNEAMICKVMNHEAQDGAPGSDDDL